MGALSRLSLRGSTAILVLFVLQLLSRRRIAGETWLTDTQLIVLWCAMSLGLVMLCAVNWRVPGMPFVSVGIP